MFKDLSRFTRQAEEGYQKYLAGANEKILAYVWYYNGNDKHITEMINNGSAPEQEQQNCEYIYEHWDELTADSVLLYDYEHPEQTKRQFDQIYN